MIVGATKYPFASSPSFDRWWAEHPEAKEATLRLTALRRVGDAEPDVAPPILFLLSDLSRYVTGSTLLADGGRYLTL